MKTPFNFLKESGAPDAVITFLAGLILVICLSPWLDISLGGVTLKTIVPWYISPIFLVVFIGLFIPFIPSKKELSAVEKELNFRFEWLREHLLNDPLTLDSALEAENALDGAGGRFRTTEEQFRDKHIEPLFDDAEHLKPLLDDTIQLRRLCRSLPRTVHPGDIVDEDVASQLRKMASRLPSRIAQQSATADAVPRRG